MISPEIAAVNMDDLEVMVGLVDRLHADTGCGM